MNPGRLAWRGKSPPGAARPSVYGRSRRDDESMTESDHLLVRSAFPWRDFLVLSLASSTLGLVLGVIHVWFFSATRLSSWTDEGELAGIDWAAATFNGALHAIPGGVPAAAITCIFAYARRRTGQRTQLGDAALGPGVVGILGLPLLLPYGPWYWVLAWVTFCFCAGTLVLWLVSRLLHSGRGAASRRETA